MVDTIPTTGPEWDLGEVLAERAQPTSEVNIYLNEVASFAKAELMKAAANTKDPESLDMIEAEIKEIEADLARSKYIVKISGIPSRMREDIASKSLHKFPMKLNFMGQDDPENAMLRGKHQNVLSWNAQIADVINPSGASKSNWTFEEMQSFSEALPVAAANAIDNAIKNVTLASEKFTTDSQNINF